jgi:hypothetical protein
VLRKALAEIIERLHVAVRKIYIRGPVAKVDVRHDKYTGVVQDPRYLSKFLGLEAPHIFKNALGDDDVEALITKPDRGLKEISLDQVRRRLVYGYVDTVVLYLWPEDGHQGCRPAANIEQRARSALREPVYNSCGLFQAIVGLAVFQVLLAPEAPLVEGAASCRVVHIARAITSHTCSAVRSQEKYPAMSGARS